MQAYGHIVDEEGKEIAKAGQLRTFYQRGEEQEDKARTLHGRMNYPILFVP